MEILPKFLLVIIQVIEDLQYLNCATAQRQVEFNVDTTLAHSRCGSLSFCHIESVGSSFIKH